MLNYDISIGTKCRLKPELRVYVFCGAFIGPHDFEIIQVSDTFVLIDKDNRKIESITYCDFVEKFDIIEEIMKCKHPNIEIIEHGTMYSSHAKDSDGNWEHWQEPGSYTEILTVKCPDCNMKRIVSKHNAPKWIKAILVELNILDK